MNEVEKLVALLSSVKTWDQEEIEQYVSLASVLIPKSDPFWGGSSPVLNQYGKMFKSELKSFGRTGKGVSYLLDMMKVFKKLFGKDLLVSFAIPIKGAAEAALFLDEKAKLLSMYKGSQSKINTYLKGKYGGKNLPSFESQIEMLVMMVILKKSEDIMMGFINAS